MEGMSYYIPCAYINSFPLNLGHVARYCLVSWSAIPHAKGRPSPSMIRDCAAVTAMAFVLRCVSAECQISYTLTNADIRCA